MLPITASLEDYVINPSIIRTWE